VIDEMIIKLALLCQDHADFVKLRVRYWRLKGLL